MQCMDRILRHLHDQSLQIGNVRPMQIDRYLAICSLLQNANSYRTTSVESSTRRMTIQCVAGCRHPGGHECVLEKPKTTAFHFDTDLVSKTPSKRIRLQSGRYVTRHVRFGAIIPLEAFVQSEEHTVQYNLLPDLGMFIRAMFLRMYFIPTVKKFTSRISHLASHTERPLSVCEHLTGSICCALIQDSIPCMKRAKRSQKGIEFRQPVGAVEITACINVVLGSLLGIYPRGVKRPIFQARVRLYGRIMTLLHQLPDEKLAFIRNYPFLTKICFMEYTFNIIHDYMPCEYRLLSEVDSMKIYRTVCQTTCDSFRQEAIVHGNEDWAAMNVVAGVCIDRCIRMCKFKMLKIGDLILKCPLPYGITFDENVLNLHNTYGCGNLLRLIHPEAPTNTIECAMHIHTNISIHPIPRQIRLQQQDIITHRYSSCYQRVYQACNLHFCMICVINGKGITTPMRMCSITGKLSCTVCNGASIMTVCMLGIILRICSVSYYMCPKCGKIKCWDGDGQDFTSNNCVTCHTPKNAAIKPRHCYICNTKNVPHPPVILPWIRERSICSVSLCGKHMPQQHHMPFIMEFEELMAAVPKYPKYASRR